MNENEGKSIELLARRLGEVQNLTLDKAKELAAKIATQDSDIARAAFEWASTNEMPEHPTVEGRTPRDLDRDFFPSQTFIILGLLRADPIHVRNSIKSMPGRRAFGQQ